MKTRAVEVWLHKKDSPIIHQATSTYQKGLMFCVLDKDRTVTKYPIWDIFRVVTPYDENEGE